MSDEELKEFKDDLQKDPELVEELDLHRSLDEIILSKDEERFRKKLDEAYKLYKIKSGSNGNEDSQGGKKIRLSYYAASLAAIFLISALIYLQFVRKESNESIFNKYLISYNGAASSRHSDTSGEIADSLESAKNLFNQSNYSEASRLFISALRENPENTEAEFYNGLCLIYLNEFEGAITTFDRVLNQPYNYFQEYARWYMVMCYIRTNQNETAKTLLKGIVAENGFFSPKAKKVLRKLR